MLRRLTRLRGGDPAPSFPILYDVNRAGRRHHSKRALLLYLLRPFQLEPDSPEFLRHQNLRRCKHIAALLDEFGYLVDAAAGRTARFGSSDDYDLIISDRADTEVSATRFESGSVRVFLATTIEHRLHNRNLRRRHAWLAERRNCDVRIRRVYPESMPYLAKTDAIVAVGNRLAADTWRAAFAGPIYPFNNYGFDGTRFVFDGKNFGEARKHFLFFASMSQVQKGLDLLLEVFPKLPDLHLYICSDFKGERDFIDCYARELRETPNIHPTGRIRVNGSRFYDLIRRCAYVIHPSCSEGQAGSVVQCMYAGLIPIVTRETGIDVDDFGIMLEDDSLEELERVVRHVSRLPEQWHREQSLKTRDVAERLYSETAFMERWREILADIVGRPSGH